jgi:lysophospholipase L1-like esterase
MMNGITLNAILYFNAGFLTAITLVSMPRWLMPQSPSQLSKRKRILFFGDSITQHGFNPDNEGWINSFNYWWTRRVDVMNRGFSGYNSKWGLTIVREVVVQERPDLVFVFFGANDACDGLQQVPLKDFQSNTEKIVNIIRNQLGRNVKIILITPPPIWEPELEEMNKMKGKTPLIDRTNEKTLLYVRAVIKAGQKLNVPVVDLWKACEGATDNRGEYLRDGLHLGPKGNNRLFEAAKDVIRNNLPEFIPEVMEMQMYDWSKVPESWK